MSLTATRPQRPSRHSTGTAGSVDSDRHGQALPRPLLWKSLLDRALAVALLLPGLPLIGLLVALVRLTSRGPGVYSQRRVGRGGLVFTMYKLRSMRIDAESATGPVWAGAASDSRVTPLGYWLRKLHLDELPQLFNVVRGEMSLVGPRPERPEFVAVLAEQIPGYMDRLAVLPGITGLAQVNLPPDTDLDSVRRKLALDCEYIQQVGLLLDLRLILCTVLRVFGLRGGRSVSLLGLHRSVTLPPTAAPIGGQPGAPPATPDTIVIDNSLEDTTTVGRPAFRNHPRDFAPADEASASPAAIGQT
jgi:lipopolysaccharide/colanic/teichoic acid biosynthesis glycosyltransferase